MPTTLCLVDLLCVPARLAPDIQLIQVLAPIYRSLPVFSSKMKFSTPSSCMFRDATNVVRANVITALLNPNSVSRNEYHYMTSRIT